MFTDHLNHRYLIIKAKLNDKKTRWIKELIAFDFTIIYRKKAKNPINGLFRRFNFKDDNKLSTMKRQPLLNFLSKFQKHLKNTKNDLTKKQNINSNETPLLKNVLNLIGTLQVINSIKMLPTRNKSKSDPTKEQNIDFNEILLFRNVLNLIKTPQDINSIRILPIKSKS